MIRRHGGIPIGKTLRSGEINYDIDLRRALEMRDKVNTSFNRLPETVRKRYPSWEAVLRGIARRELMVADNTIKPRPVDRPPEKTETPSTKGDTPPETPKN